MSAKRGLKCLDCGQEQYFHRLASVRARCGDSYGRYEAYTGPDRRAGKKERRALLPASPSPAEPTSAEEPLGWAIIGHSKEHAMTWLTGDTDYFDERAESDERAAHLNAEPEQPWHFYTVEPVGRPTSAPGERIEGWARYVGGDVWDFEKADHFKSGPDDVRATLILHPPAPPTEEPRA